jgi:hypothetical protein
MSLDIEARGRRLARLWILIAVTYLLVGACFGVYMGATQVFTFMPVHAHINLLGWASMALAGLIYDRFPLAGGSKLGVAHFWMHNLTLPVLMVLLACFFAGNAGLAPVVGMFSVLMLLTLVVFAVNLYLHLGRSQAA